MHNLMGYLFGSPADDDNGSDEDLLARCSGDGHTARPRRRNGARQEEADKDVWEKNLGRRCAAWDRGAGDIFLFLEIHRYFELRFF